MTSIERQPALRRSTTVPLSVMLSAGLLAILIKAGRIVAPGIVRGTIFGFLPSALTGMALSWAALFVSRDTRIKRAFIIGGMGGTAMYEWSQRGIPGRTFDWWDVVAGTIAMIPAFLAAGNYGRIQVATMTLNRTEIT